MFSTSKCSRITSKEGSGKDQDGERWKSSQEAAPTTDSADSTGAPELKGPICVTSFPLGPIPFLDVGDLGKVRTLGKPTLWLSQFLKGRQLKAVCWLYSEQLGCQSFLKEGTPGCKSLYLSHRVLGDREGWGWQCPFRESGQGRTLWQVPFFLSWSCCVSSPTRVQTHIPALGMQSLNHRTTGEVPLWQV